LRILVTGAQGMLGRALVPVLERRHEVWGTDVQDCDIRDAQAVSGILHARRPANSVLENRALQRMNLSLMPAWEVALTEYLEEIKQSGEARTTGESTRATAQ